MPFTLDRLADVPRYVYPSSFLTKCDDKSGYDHVLLTVDSRSYFGFSFAGLWFVCTTLPFGWNILPYVYHTVFFSGVWFPTGTGCSVLSLH